MFSRIFENQHLSKQEKTRRAINFADKKALKFQQKRFKFSKYKSIDEQIKETKALISDIETASKLILDDYKDKILKLIHQHDTLQIFEFLFDLFYLY